MRWCQGPYVMSCSIIIITASAKRPNTMQLRSFPCRFGKYLMENICTISYTFFSWHPLDSDDLSAMPLGQAQWFPTPGCRCGTAVMSSTSSAIKRCAWQNRISSSLVLPKESQDQRNMCCFWDDTAKVIKNSSLAPDLPFKRFLHCRRGCDYKQAPNNLHAGTIPLLP